jgi:hypothetical protein
MSSSSLKVRRRWEERRAWMLFTGMSFLIFKCISDVAGEGNTVVIKQSIAVTPLYERTAKNRTVTVIATIA